MEPGGGSIRRARSLVLILLALSSAPRGGGAAPEDAAAELVKDGVDTVLVCNQIDPLPTSGVDQEAYLVGGEAPSVATDRTFSDALRAAGMREFQTTALFFDPDLLASFPDARPVDATGEVGHGFDWYRGVCPTHDGYLKTKIARLRRVAEELEPAGFFLSFTLAGLGNFSPFNGAMSMVPR